MRAHPLRAAPLAAVLALVAAIAGPAAAEGLVVPIDHSTRLQLGGAAASVVVGNPAVADVTVVDSHTVFVSGRAYGATDVVVLDRAGRTVFSGDVIVGAAQSGRVSIYRGRDRTDLACAPGCQVASRGDTGGGSASGGSSSKAGGLLGALAGAGGAMETTTRVTASPGL